MNQQPSSPPSAALAGADAPVLCVSSQTWRRGSLLRRLFWQVLALVAGAGLAWSGRPEWRHWPPPGAQ